MDLNSPQNVNLPIAERNFVTNCPKAKVNEYAIKYMGGHKISDIAEMCIQPKNLNGSELK
jgi:hypothetical protein